MIILDEKEFHKLSGLTYIIARNAMNPQTTSQVAKEVEKVISANIPGTIKSIATGELNKADDLSTYRKKPIKLRNLFFKD